MGRPPDRGSGRGPIYLRSVGSLNVALRRVWALSGIARTMSTTMSTTPNAASATPAVDPVASMSASALTTMLPPALPLSVVPETATMTAPATNPPLSDLQTLRNHIDTLTNLNSRLQTLRHFPALLMRPPATASHMLPPTSVLEYEFKELKEIAQSVRSEQVQDALKAARKSEASEPKVVGLDVRRENLKRRHVRTFLFCCAYV